MIAGSTKTGKLFFVYLVTNVVFVRESLFFNNLGSGKNEVNNNPD